MNHGDDDKDSVYGGKGLSGHVAQSVENESVFSDDEDPAGSRSILNPPNTRSYESAGRPAARRRLTLDTGIEAASI